MKLFIPFVLPNDVAVPNRLAKAATEKDMVDAGHTPSDMLLRLYEVWVASDAGLILIDSVMIDHRAMTGLNDVALEDDAHLERFRRQAQVARAYGVRARVQINHPGRQISASLEQLTLASSAVLLALGVLSRQFPVSRGMTKASIDEVQQRLTCSAQLAEQGGFTGVQIHAAHDYLLNQFLLLISSWRQDQWGDPIENCARLLLDIVRSVRTVVSLQFVVVVKLNSADFQRGGLSSDDAKQTVEPLNSLGVGLVELSGDSYEVSAMQGYVRDGYMLTREAYFLELARGIATAARMPLMVMGGIRRRTVAEQVVNSGVDMVGTVTVLSIDPNLPHDWAGDKNNVSVLQPVTWKNKALGALANMAVVRFQLNRLSEGRMTGPRVSPLRALTQQ